MEIRDVIHGAIAIAPHELPVVDSRFFQRLRHIRQLGFGEQSFPSATHNRYIHSLGAMHTASKAFDSIFHGRFERFKPVVRLAALLHDVGHGPLSHTSEVAMPQVHDLKVPGKKQSHNRMATHEDYTLKIILDSSLTEFLERAGKTHGFKPLHVAALIDPELETKDRFFEEKVDGQMVSFHPILSQLISSELDADRMDYLRRDSLHAGVSYGEFDYDWLLSNLTYHIQDKKCYLSLQHKALYSFEDFLISRFHMFLMVYFHHKNVIFDEMLARYFESPDCTYKLPTNIEQYCEYNDSHLYTQMAQSKNEWAGRIVNKKPYKMMLELHSGIPTGTTAASEQEKLLSKIQSQLKKEATPFILSQSTGELSKYFRKQADPIFVRYDNLYSQPAYIPLQKCTDLFQRYSEKRSITRIYVPAEHVQKMQKNRSHEPLRYLEN